MNQTRMKEVKKVAKRIKKAFEGELTLSQVHHALSRALGFMHLHELQKCLAVPSASPFWAMVEMLVPIPDDPTFQAAVARFAESSGITTEAANSLCIQHLLPMLESGNSFEQTVTRSPKEDCIHMKNHHLAHMVAVPLTMHGKWILMAPILPRSIRVKSLGRRK